MLESTFVIRGRKSCLVRAWLTQGDNGACQAALTLKGPSCGISHRLICFLPSTEDFEWSRAWKCTRGPLKCKDTNGNSRRKEYAQCQFCYTLLCYTLDRSIVADLSIMVYDKNSRLQRKAGLPRNLPPPPTSTSAPPPPHPSLLPGVSPRDWGCYLEASSSPFHPLTQNRKKSPLPL